MNRRSAALLAILTAAVATAIGWAVVRPATLDHCYHSYGPREEFRARCVGHWNWLAWRVDGPVEFAGRDGTSWQVMRQEADANGEWEVTFPAGERQLLVLAGASRAASLSSPTAAGMIGACLLGGASAALMLLRAGRRVVRGGRP